jgi:hypothetical protein
MSEQWTWQPIQDSDAPTVYGGNIQVIGGAELHIYIAGRRYTKQLREGYALCRRVPAQAGELERLRDEVARLRDALMQSEMDHLIRDTYGVPAQGAGVPYPIRSVLHAALILYITECRQVDDPDGEALARQAQQWLDAQPSQPGQGGNDGDQ